MMADPVAPEKPPGKIVTFYSYKGGTGRTLALANVAWLLVASGARVLAIDWDLEAPGLHRYLMPFLRDPELKETKGVIDLFWDYVSLVLTPPGSWPSSIKAPTDLANFRPYAATLENPFEDRGGFLRAVFAGQQTPAYATMFRDFDWRALYQKHGGEAFVDALVERARFDYDFVLIDSRTGVADTSGICTVQMPDEVVLCFTYNRQSVKGVAAVAQSIAVQRKDLPPVWPLPMRVEKGIEGLDEARGFAREELDRFLPKGWAEKTRDEYWKSCEIAYYPDYAFGETLAVFRDRQTRNSLAADMLWLASRLAEARRKVGLPALDDAARASILLRYRLRDPRKAEVTDLMAQPLGSSSARLLVLMDEALKSDAAEDDYLAFLADAFKKAVTRSALEEPRLALALAIPATEAYRRLDGARPREFQSQLADSLSQLGAIQSALGRHDEALKATAEALAIRRMAMAEAIRRSLAVGSSKDEAEALAIRRSLAKDEAAALALSLSNLVSTLSELGQHDQALAAAEEGTQLYRELNAANSPEFSPKLAASLGALAKAQGGLGLQAEALKSWREAVSVYDTLARIDPATFNRDLAAALDNLADALKALGRTDEALDVAKRAVALNRALAETRDEPRPVLAVSSAQTGTRPRGAAPLEPTARGAGVKKLFLSYSVEDRDFKKKFTGRDIFGDFLGDDVALFDYENDGNFGSIANFVSESIASSAAIVLFISRNYIKDSFTAFEFWKGLGEAARRRLVFVPVLMDAEAKEWWRKQKTQGGLNDLTPEGGEYAYVDFSGSDGRPVALYENGRYHDRSAQKIKDLAIYIRKTLEEIASERPATPSPPPTAANIVILGRPDGWFSKELQTRIDELVLALQAHGAAPTVWSDGWASPDNSLARRKTSSGSLADAVFVQPLSSYDARLVAIQPELVRESLAELPELLPAGRKAGLRSRIVIWLPSDLKDPRFETATAEFPTTLSNGSPESLAEEIIAELGSASPEAPVIMLEEFTFNPELRAALHGGFQQVVEMEVSSPPITLGFEFREASLFLEKQIRLIRGNRAIIAIHDLNVSKASEGDDVRRSIEQKLTAAERRVRSAEQKSGRASPLNIFWALLVYAHAEELPFVRYPSPRFRQWHLLPFTGTACGVAPEPTAAEIFRSYLRQWIEAPK